MGKLYPQKIRQKQKSYKEWGRQFRHAGDDGSAAFRIPGGLSTNKGTLGVCALQQQCRFAGTYRHRPQPQYRTEHGKNVFTSIIQSNTVDFLELRMV